MPRKPEHSARKGAQDEVSCQVALTIDTKSLRSQRTARMYSPLRRSARVSPEW
jgi:hypothetical protein